MNEPCLAATFRPLYDKSQGSKELSDNEKGYLFAHPSKDDITSPRPKRDELDWDDNDLDFDFQRKIQEHRADAIVDTLKKSSIILVCRENHPLTEGPEGPFRCSVCHNPFNGVQLKCRICEYYLCEDCQHDPQVARKIKNGSQSGEGLQSRKESSRNEPQRSMHQSRDFRDNNNDQGDRGSHNGDNNKNHRTLIYGLK